MRKRGKNINGTHLNLRQRREVRRHLVAAHTAVVSRYLRESLRHLRREDGVANGDADGTPRAYG